MSECWEKNNESEPPSNSMKKLNLMNISDRFHLYRRAAESNEKKLREAQAVIEELRNYIQTTKQVEDNLRHQLESSEKRLISLHKIFTRFLNISEKQDQNEKTIAKIQEKVEDFQKIINDLNEKTRKVLETASKEIDLMNRNKELKMTLENIESSYDLSKIEYKTLLRDKDEMETQFRKKIEILEDELKKSMRETDEMKTKCEATESIYKKQIENHEAVIREYESERQSLLEDFELPKRPDNCKNRSSNLITSPDTTVATYGLPDENVSKSSRDVNGTNKPSIPIEEIKSQPVFHFATSAKTGKNNVFSQDTGRIGSTKQKPSLDFLSGPKTSNPSSTSPEMPTKRRLFSTNCNHYLI